MPSTIDLKDRLDTMLTGEPNPKDTLALIREMLPNIASRIPAMLEHEGGSNTVSALLAKTLAKTPMAPDVPEAEKVGCTNPSAVADYLIVAASDVFGPHMRAVALATARAFLV